MKLKPKEVLTTETCGEEACSAMSEIIYHPGTILPDTAVGLCSPHNVQYTLEGPAGIVRGDASNSPSIQLAETEGKKKRGRGRPKKGEGPHDTPPPPIAIGEDLTAKTKTEPPTPPLPGVVTSPAPVVETRPAAYVNIPPVAPPAPTSEDLEIPKMPMVLAFTNEAKEEAAATLGMLREVKLVTPEQEQWAMNAANTLAKKHDELEKKRKSWTAPLKKVTSDIEGEFRPVLQLLTQGIDILKSKVGEYRYALEQEKRTALAAMQTAVQSGDVAQAQALATQIEVSAPPPPDKGSVKMIWTGQVTDPTAIPREYLVPDVNALLTLTASLKRDPGIPGWKAWEVPDVKISRR